MTRNDKRAIFLSLLAVLITAWVAHTVFEGLPHLEDEFAYRWQARVISRGALTTPTPPEAESFLVPFVVDHRGERFGKYPLGWPVVLSAGEKAGLPWLVNPILGGLAVWLTYRLGKKLFGELAGLLAAGLTLFSPFFIIQSGSLLSHAWGLVLSLAFTLAWLDTTRPREDLPGWLPPLVAGLSLGCLAISRPYTALAVALPFGMHGLILLWRGSRRMRLHIVSVGTLVVILSSLHFLWQYAVTGDPLLNPYLLWWPYDKIGFGPGHGIAPGGHALFYAWDGFKASIYAGIQDLFGWGLFSWILIPFGVWAARKKRPVWPVMAVFPTLVIFYLAYWVGAWVFGPRYYYEGLYSLTLLSAAGIIWLAGWQRQVRLELPSRIKDWGRPQWRSVAVITLLAILVAANLGSYLPQRLTGIQERFGVQRADLDPFLTPQAQALTPALVIVHTDDWRQYADLLELASPFLDSPFIFIWTAGYSSDQIVIKAFPERTVVHYYPDQPGEFFDRPQH